MQLFARFFVLLTGIIWAGYGIAVLFHPNIIAILTGANMDHWTASLEIQSFYLVTEIALCILAFHGWQQPQKYLRLNLLIWLITFTQLVLFRFIGTWYYDSYFDIRVGLAHLPDSYHIATAWFYELPSMLVFSVLWLKRDQICA